MMTHRVSKLLNNNKPGWRKNQGIDAVRILAECMKYWQCERSRFTASGLAACNHVEACNVTQNQVRGANNELRPTF